LSVQTQSARGENRPGSQGFGSAPAGASAGATNAAASTTFSGGAEASNNILGQQAEGGEHDSASYGGLYGGQVASGHNGATGGDAY
jgi:nuclear transcription Y subunit beta